MPGLFGAFGCDSKHYDSLCARFRVLFGSCDWKQLPNGILGAHAFGEASPLQQVGKNYFFVVDGESSIYRDGTKFANQNGPPLFEIKDGIFRTTELCKGNIAVLDDARQMLFLSADWCGVFPLYYTQVDGGILFCSHCKPLAAVTDPSPDYVGIIEYMLCGYLIGDRTLFQKVHRLLPGQVLTYSLRDRSFTLGERSCYWTEILDAGSPKLDISYIWETFRQACRRSFNPGEVHGVMLSAGWDSRFVLGGLLEVTPASRIYSVSFGDLRSREIGLARAISRSSGVRHLELSTEDHLSDLDGLRMFYDRCETAEYPYWHRAAQRIASEGVTCVSAGLPGAVFGGHSGLGSVHGPWGKAKYLASNVFLPMPQARCSSGDDVARAALFLKRCFDRRPWYLKEDFWQSVPNFREILDNDIDAEVKRYQQRGISSGDHVFEAYRTEHHGAQHMCRQMLTCRATMDIASPFTDRDFMMLASGIPMSAKIHNSLNRKLLRAFFPGLLRYPTAAILVPASFPIIIQESTRLLRWAIDEIGSNLYFKSRGKIEAPRMEWVNFSSLRDGAAFTRLTDDMHLELLDKDAIQSCIDDMAHFRRKIDPQALDDQLLRIYTVELMFR